MPTLTFTSRIEASADALFAWHARPGLFRGPHDKGQLHLQPWLDKPVGDDPNAVIVQRVIKDARDGEQNGAA